ncbi:EAL domain-containing protein [Oxalobacteraceae bacterium CAVE-383]|nr:EAL domain-containing protein [Oxalobacteraceae bacterium CAVE-383]
MQRKPNISEPIMKEADSSCKKDDCRDDDCNDCNDRAEGHAGPCVVQEPGRIAENDRYCAGGNPLPLISDPAWAPEWLEQAVNARQRQRFTMRLIDCMPSGLIAIALDGTIQTVSRSAKELLGLSTKCQLEGEMVATLISDRDLVDSIEAALVNPRYRNLMLIRVPCVGSDRRSICCTLRCTVSHEILDGQGQVLVIAENVTAALLAEAELRESEARSRQAFEHAVVGLAHVALDGRWLRVNRRFLGILGHTEQSLLELRFQDMTAPEDLPLDNQLRTRLIAGEIPSYTREKRYRHKDGHFVWVHITVAPRRIGDGEMYLALIIEDISQRKLAEEKLLHLANHDPLTGLFNRALLNDRLSQAVTYATRAERHVAVLFIDLDRFKNINDSLGHDAGDRVIVEVARRLNANVRDGDTVARLGGDEFVVVLADIAHESEIAAIARKMLDALFAPMDMDGQELSPVGSIGVAVFPRDGDTAATLLANADAAMYRVKEMGCGNFQFYQPCMNTRALDRLKLEAGLRRALERNEFVLHYQPQIDIPSGAIVGAEALLRWQPPGRAMVHPGDFIPIAEETGLIVPIGEWVLRTACAQQVAWKNAGLRNISMAVNLSARQFKQQDLHQMVANVLTDTQCAADQLDLEITESVVMDDPEAAAATLQLLTDMGVHLSIDDFGTGYSSLSYLKRFPIHSLKIDRSFVCDIPANSNDAAIATAVIALAHSMKLTVVAEGVETAEQLEFLRERQCDSMQGFLCGRPMPSEEVALLLAK